MNTQTIQNLWEQKEIRVAVFVFLSIFIFKLFQWTLVDYVTVFLFPVIEGVLIISFLVYFVRGFLRAFAKNNNRTTSIVLAINLVTALMYIFFPFTEISLHSDFKFKLSAREEVVMKIKSGELTNNIDYNKRMIHLSLSDGLLSKGGNDVIFEGNSGHLSVFFYTFRGVIDNFAGIIYKEDNVPPTNEDFNCGYLIDSLKFRDNWYWMSCT